MAFAETTTTERKDREKGAHPVARPPHTTTHPRVSVLVGQPFPSLSLSLCHHTTQTARPPRTGGSMLMTGRVLRSRRPAELPGVMAQSAGGRQAITCAGACACHEIRAQRGRARTHTHPAGHTDQAPLLFFPFGGGPVSFPTTTPPSRLSSVHSALKKCSPAPRRAPMVCRTRAAAPVPSVTHTRRGRQVRG